MPTRRSLKELLQRRRLAGAGGDGSLGGQSRVPSGQPGGGRFASAKDKAMNYLKSEQGKATVKDLIVNTGGLAASMAGHSVGGSVGQLAGDLIGALATRQAVHMISTTLDARDKIKTSRRL